MKREPERSYDLDPQVLVAINHAISAGACRVAARINPNHAATWNAVAEAKSRDAAGAIAKMKRFAGEARK